MDEATLPKKRPEKKAFTVTDHSFDMTPHFLHFLTSNGFFAEISRHLTRTPTRDIKYAMVAFDPKEDAFHLYWNPDSFARMTPSEVQGVLHHEFFHIVFGHLAGTGYSHTLNVAQDCAINSIIQKMGADNSSSTKVSLPWFVCNPGVAVRNEKGHLLTAEEIEKYPLAKLISSLPAGGTTQQYMQALSQSGVIKEIPGELELDVSGFIFDEHDHNDDNYDYIMARMKGIIKKAAANANSQGNWGNIPMAIRHAIQRYVRSDVDWSTLLARFVGNSVKSHKRSSITQINKRYPYIHPGILHNRYSRIIIFIDQSGSVNDQMLTEIYGALPSLTHRIEVDMIPFDCSADVNDLVTWKKGCVPVMERTKQGGTDFNAPTRIVNDKKNRGRWDACIIVTDGCAPKPIPSVIPRAWILPKGCKIEFQTTETKMIIDSSAGALKEF